MSFGNLDNLNLGMGLVLKPGQVLPVENASLEGYRDSLGYFGKVEPQIWWNILHVIVGFGIGFQARKLFYSKVTK